MPELLPLEFISKTKRLHILAPTELDDLYARPQLTEDQRIYLFELNKDEQNIIASNISMATKIDAIIRLGYFKHKQQFFLFNLHEITDDVNHVMERYFSHAKLDRYSIGREAKLKNQQWVLRMTGYTLFSQAQHASILANKAEKLCRLSVNPIFIFRELLSEISNKNITRPGYSTLQKIISAALMTEQKRISHIFKEHLSAQEKQQLFKLLNQAENFYAVTLLKQQPKNFKPTAIRQEIEYYEQYQNLYLIAKRLLPLVDISKNGVAYYASLVEHYTVQSLGRIHADQTCPGLSH